MEFVCGYSGSCFHKADFESGVHAEWMTKEKLSGTDKAAEMECYKQRWVGAILVSALVAESRNCRHGFFSSSGTGCGIRGIAWAGLHDDVPEKGLTLSASCRGMTVSCPAHPCGGRKIFQIIPWEERRSGAQALDPRPRFQIRFRHFFARWSKVPMDLGMPMCSRLLIHAYGTSVLCLTARAMMSLDGWL